MSINEVSMAGVNCISTSAKGLTTEEEKEEDVSTFELGQFSSEVQKLDEDTADKLKELFTEESEEEDEEETPFEHGVEAGSALADKIKDAIASAAQTVAGAIYGVVKGVADGISMGLGAIVGFLGLDEIPESSEEHKWGDYPESPYIHIINKKTVSDLPEGVDYAKLTIENSSELEEYKNVNEEETEEIKEA